MTIILVRHGESEGNARRIVQGTLDVPLTALGRAQALAVGARLASQPVRAVYASGLRRAMGTAEAIAGRHNLPVQTVEALREVSFGEAQGLTWDELVARWPVTGLLDAADLIPGAAPLVDVRARAGEAVDRLLDRHRDDLAVCVSHGGAIAQIVAHLLRLPSGTIPRIRLANAAMTVIEGGAAAPVIALFNDGCHLAAPTAPTRG